MTTRLPRSFFAGDAVTVARNLLGKSLYRRYHGITLGGIIVETEAYLGEDDSACHASRGCTPRTRVLYGEAGHYYVYLIYGMYHMLNIVTGEEGHPQAVLIRALLPEKGISCMQTLRHGISGKRLCDGPGKLCQALAVDKSFNARQVNGGELWLEDAATVNDALVTALPRVGIAYASTEDQQKLWRFLLESR
jgi:DNA-3-methyladenine glycosylase